MAVLMVELERTSWISFLPRFLWFLWFRVRRRSSYVCLRLSWSWALRSSFLLGDLPVGIVAGVVVVGVVVGVVAVGAGEAVPGEVDAPGVVG